MIKFKEYIEPYVPFNEPIPYIPLAKQITEQNQTESKKELLIYPISLRQSEIFLKCCSILTIDKDSIPEPSIIKMTYLQFLYVMFFEGQDVELFKNLMTILKICFQIENEENIYFDLDENNKPFIKINGTIINSKDFDNIRKLILFQNIEDYDDAYLDPDYKKSIEDYQRLKNKDVTIPTLERQLAIVTASTGIMPDKLFTMTYRSFSILFRTVGEPIDYLVQNMALCNGAKIDIDHWIYKKKKANKIDDGFVSFENMEKKFKK